MEWVKTEEKLPDVRTGNSKEFIVCCVRQRDGNSGKQYVFAAEYLNQMLLQTDSDDEPEDGTPFTGWYIRNSDNTDYDYAYESVCGEGDVVTHWMALPEPPAGA